MRAEGPFFLFKSEKKTDEGHLKQMRQVPENLFFFFFWPKQHHTKGNKNGTGSSLADACNKGKCQDDTKRQVSICICIKDI